jgi:hypothetical protein
MTSQPADEPATDAATPKRKPTTAKSDGSSPPDGHVLPAGYELRPPGRAVFHVARREDPRTKKPVETVSRVTYGPLFVVRMYASHEGEQWFDLQWPDHGRVVVRRVDGAVLRSGRALVRELGIVGVPVVEADAKPVERYLAAYLVANGTALYESRVTIARFLGWQDDGTTFVTGDGAPWPVEPSQPEQRPALAAHRPKGTLAGWQEAIARIERYPVVRIALAAAFAAPLLRIIGERSFTLDISGRSTRGKTTAAAVVLSPWADPSSEGDGMATWKATQIMIEKRLNLVRGLPVVLDETRVAKSPEIVDQVLYQVSMNRGQARGGDWASLLPWHTILISTGEQPALSFTPHEGAAARTLSLRRAPFGTDGPRSAEDARAVTVGINRHHGTAGPAFIARLRALLAEPDGTERLLARHAELTTLHTEAARNDIARRRAPLVAALHLGAALAHEWEIVPLPPVEVEVFSEHFSQEAARDDRGEMALDIVRGLIATQDHRIRPLGHRPGQTPAGGWIGTHTVHEGLPAIALTPESLAEALGRATPPIVLETVKQAWTEAGTIPMDKREPTKLPRVAMPRDEESDKKSENRTRMYVFYHHVLDGEDTPDGVGAQTATEPGQERTGYQQEELGAGGWPKGSYGDLAWRERPQL